MTSKIKVDNIENQCGGAVVTKCGGTTTISGTVVKSNTLQASDAGNIISQSGTTITLGASGDTINLASGASQSGFGRTGTVDWQTGSIKTATFTAANGEGYFANTSGGAFTMNLPAGTAGNIVSVVDYTNTFQTNNLTVAPNGSEKIGGIAQNAILNTEGQSVTFVYVDGTEGWKNVQDSTSNVTGSPFLQATGGTITTCGNCKIHTFTGPGTFCVSSISTNCAAENTVSHLVIAGGGGGVAQGGAGGAGGFREVKSPLTPYTASPLDGYPSAPNRITVTAAAFPITVGAGGGAGPETNGSNSVFSTITSAGGGSTQGGGPQNGSTGGSGGGGSGSVPGSPTGSGGAGNTPPVSPPQGNSGGDAGSSLLSGGGGGAGGSGTNVSGPTGGPGGNGVATSITGSSVTRGGGGGGGFWNGVNGPGGAGGPGGGGSAISPYSNGVANTGGGGAGAPAGNSGGSGIVVIRYKFQ